MGSSELHLREHGAHSTSTDEVLGTHSPAPALDTAPAIESTASQASAYLLALRGTPDDLIHAIASQDTHAPAS